jgi:hypothetical protein
MDTLQKYKEKPLYEVPEHFFEQLQNNVMHRVAQVEKQQKTFRKWISAISVAASFAIIVTLSVFLFFNRDTNPHFYVHEDITQHEDSIFSFDSNPLAAAPNIIADASEESFDTQEPVSAKPSVSENDAKESIVYRAVDYYIDDYETNNFYEAMYDLECYYDY